MATKKGAAKAAAISTPYPVFEEGDVRRHLDEAAVAKFNAKEWQGRIVAANLIAYAQKAGRLLSVEDVEQYISAREAEKEEKKAKEEAFRRLLDERPDPDAAPQPCGAKWHRGANPAIRPESRFLIRRGEDGNFIRLTHARGGRGEIRGGDFLVIGGQKVFHCRRCHEAALYEARRGAYRLMWYMSAAADRKVAAIREADERRRQAIAARQAAVRHRPRHPADFFPSTKRGERRGERHDE